MKLIVNPHKIEIEKSPVNEREVNITKCEFEFADEITNEYVKEAYFTFKGNTYKQIIFNNECDIPSEVLTEQGQIEIGVVAFKIDNELIRYNPSPAYFNSWIGSLKDNAENSDPITPSEMEQYEQELQEGLEEVNSKLPEINQAIEDVNNAITETNNLDLDVSKEGKVATVTLTKKDATTKTVTLSDGTSLMFNWDGTKLGIKTDEDADYTYVDLQGIQGPIGPQGEAFQIKKTYSSIAEMNADFNNMQLGDYVMIASTVEIEDNAKLYTRGEEQWIFISDFSGAQGIKGETGATPNIQIGTVTSGATPSVTRTGTNENPVLNFVLEKGDKGDTGQTGATGPTGNGIASIAQTSTSGLVDTYTITYTDGTTTTFTVTNGEDGEVTQAQLDALDRKVEHYKKYSNALAKVSASGTELTIDDTAECPMEMELEPSEISQVAEPTPSTPQDIHTISGDNKINVSNSIFEKDKAVWGTLQADGSVATSNQTYTTDFIEINPNKKYYMPPKGSIRGKYFDSNKTPLNTTTYNDLGTVDGNSATILNSIPSNAKYIRTTIDKTYIDNFYIVINGQTYKEQNYPIYLSSTPLEYCKIGNYADVFMKPSGKNLFDNALFETFTTSNKYITLSLKPNTTYTMSSNIPVYSVDNSSNLFAYNSSGSPATSTNGIKPNVSRNITTLSDGIVIVAYRNLGNELTNPETKYWYMLNEGSTALPYEPFNNGKWYLKKNIGKVVFDGSEDENWSASKTNQYAYTTDLANVILKPTNTATAYIGLCNLLIARSYNNVYTNHFEGTSCSTGGNVNFHINGVTDDENFSVEIWRNYISTNNIELYIALATPNYILLNNTLQEQLDNIYEWALSYQEQTNISQVNDDLPFVINARACYDLNKLIERVTTLEGTQL